MTDKKLKLKLKKWLYKNLEINDLDIDFGDEYIFNSVDDKIVISKELPDHMESYRKYIGKFVDLKNNYYIVDDVLCFLHELGHFITIWEVNDSLAYIDSKIKDLVLLDSYTKLGMEIKTQIYYRLPLEKEATKWAADYLNINFITKESESIKELQEIFNEWRRKSD